MLYLKIENVGEAPVEGFTLFGATTKRHENDPMVIGIFGGGVKSSLGLLLRNNISPTVYCGAKRLEFYTKDVTVPSAKRVTTHKKVCVRHSGESNRTEELSFVLDYGTTDWTSVELAAREFVSNALDGSLDHTDNWDSVKIEIVDQSKVRAKKGLTQVFIPLTPEIQKFYNEIDKWFLHFKTPELLKEKILPKDERNQSGKQTAILYRRGVFVRQIENSDKASIFDYNLDFPINESRTFDDYQATHVISRAWRDATPIQLGRLLNAMYRNEDCWEKSLSGYSLLTSEDNKDAIAKRSKNWKKAFDLVFNKTMVMTKEDRMVSQLVESKGYKPVQIPDGWIRAIKQYGLRTYDDVLTDDDLNSRTLSEATPAVVKTFEYVWGRLGEIGMLAGAKKPSLGCFYEPVKNETQTWGQYRAEENKILIHTDIADGSNEFLKWAMCEEICHCISQAEDFSRSFQCLLVRIISKLI